MRTEVRLALMITLILWLGGCNAQLGGRGNASKQTWNVFSTVTNVQAKPGPETPGKVAWIGDQRYIKTFAGWQKGNPLI